MPQKKTNVEATISFRCPESWKREVYSAASLTGQRMGALCIKALSKYLRVETPRKEDAA